MDKQEVKLVYKEIVSGLKDIDNVKFEITNKSEVQLTLKQGYILRAVKQDKKDANRKILFFINNTEIRKLPFTFWQAMVIARLAGKCGKIIFFQRRQQAFKNKLFNQIDKKPPQKSEIQEAIENITGRDMSEVAKVTPTSVV